MLYYAYEAQRRGMDPLRSMAAFTAGLLETLDDGGRMPAARAFGSYWHVAARLKLTHQRPPYDIKTVKTGNREAAVSEVAADATPFGTLLHFKKDSDIAQPRILVVAPLSGHFATLLRGTVETLLADHDVYLTDWHNARDIPPEAGRFGFEDYIEHVIRFMRRIGPGAHVLAVCQPCVQVLAAAA